MDDGCFAKLVRRGYDPAASVAILVALRRAAVGAVAELVGGGKGGGDMTKGRGGGGIEGRVIVVAVGGARGSGHKIGNFFCPKHHF